MNKIAIFGGTFNPVHNGHINLCNECQNIYNFDKILLIPTNIPPHKKPVDLASNQDRYNMLKLAISGNDKFDVSEIEYKYDKKSYTINTVLSLKKQYPNSEFYFILGSDMLKTFNEWYRYEDILKEVKLVVGARHQKEFSELLDIKSKFSNLAEKIDIVNINVMEISSTMIRENITKNKDIKNLVDNKVLKYITEHNLYK